MGFTLLELLMALAIVGLLTAVAVPSYRKVALRQQIATATVELSEIAHAIQRYRTTRFTVPQSLDELEAIPRIDPWGYSYRFLNFSAPIPGINGMIRKDHNLHPLNTEFDLYSIGPDGRSVSPLTAAPSRDDVIWARDGGFVGVARDY
jgi:general secretion pathway protein G